MAERKPFSMTVGPRRPDEVLAAAVEVERCVGEIANGLRKPGHLPVKEIAILIQHARDTGGKKP